MCRQECAAVAYDTASASLTVVGRCREGQGLVQASLTQGLGWQRSSMCPHDDLDVGREQAGGKYRPLNQVRKGEERLEMGAAWECMPVST